MEDKFPIEELLYEEEGTTLDFKGEPYKFNSASDHEKSELLKDILAFSNAWRRVDAYILIGVEEVKGGRCRIVGIQDSLDDAQLQQFVNSKTQRPIEFNYRTVLIDGLKVGVLCIPVQRRPYYLEKDYGKLKKHVVYICRGSSTSDASPEEVRDMGRSEIQDSQEIPDLYFEFANPANRSSLGTRIDINSKILKIPPMNQIPDYVEDNQSRSLRILGPQVRKDYYRELVRYYYVANISTELSFLLRNDSSKAISDIRVELIVQKNKFNFSFLESNNSLYKLPKSHFDPIKDIAPIRQQLAEINRRKIEIQDLKDFFRVEIPFEKVQPKQTVFATQTVYIISNENFTIEPEVTIYADNIPLPIMRKLQISANVIEYEGSLERIIELHRENMRRN